MKKIDSVSYLILICTGIIFTNFTCNNCEDFLQDTYLFTANLSPLHSSFNINDTIQLYTEFNTSLNLEYSNNIYDASTEQIKFSFEIFEVPSINRKRRPARESFEIISHTNEIMTHSNNLSQVQIKSTCSSETCGFSIDVIPKKTGYFVFTPSYGLIYTSDECNQINIIHKEIISNGNNFEILEEINTTELFGNSTLMNPELEHQLYFFKVIN